MADLPGAKEEYGFWTCECTVHRTDPETRQRLRVICGAENIAISPWFPRCRRCQGLCQDQEMALRARDNAKRLNAKMFKKMGLIDSEDEQAGNLEQIIASAEAKMLEREQAREATGAGDDVASIGGTSGFSMLSARRSSQASVSDVASVAQSLRAHRPDGTGS